jgi:hypothetical protein
VTRRGTVRITERSSLILVIVDIMEGWDDVWVIKVLNCIFISDTMIVILEVVKLWLTKLKVASGVLGLEVVFYWISSLLYSFYEYTCYVCQSIQKIYFVSSVCNYM